MLLWNEGIGPRWEHFVLMCHGHGNKRAEIKGDTEILWIFRLLSAKKRVVVVWLKLGMFIIWIT